MAGLGQPPLALALGAPALPRRHFAKRARGRRLSPSTRVGNSRVLARVPWPPVCEARIDRRASWTECARPRCCHHPGVSSRKRGSVVWVVVACTTSRCKAPQSKFPPRLQCRRCSRNSTYCLAHTLQYVHTSCRRHRKPRAPSRSLGSASLSLYVHTDQLSLAFYLS